MQRYSVKWDRIPQIISGTGGRNHFVHYKVYSGTIRVWCLFASFLKRVFISACTGHWQREALGSVRIFIVHKTLWMWGPDLVFTCLCDICEENPTFSSLWQGSELRPGGWCPGTCSNCRGGSKPVSCASLDLLYPEIIQIHGNMLSTWSCLIFLRSIVPCSLSSLVRILTCSPSYPSTET